MEYKCLKCNTDLVASQITSAVTLVISKKPLKRLGRLESEAFPYVCPNCGYIEWYVNEPEKFK